MIMAKCKCGANKQTIVKIKIWHNEKSKRVMSARHDSFAEKNYGKDKSYAVNHVYLRMCPYSVTFFMMMAALCPPNPKVLESTAFISLFCALLKVKFRL